MRKSELVPPTQSSKTAIDCRFLTRLTEAMMPRTHATLALLIGVLACCDERKPRQSDFEIQGSEAQRINALEEILQKHSPKLPGPISTPHFLQEQIGDGNLGPSDFSSFYAFTVAQDDMAAWIAHFGPLKTTLQAPAYAAPQQAKSWWLSAKKFSGLDYYNSKKLTGRNTGWIAVDPSTGEVFVHTMTM